MKRITRSLAKNTSTIKGHLANDDNITTTLMIVLTDKLKEFLKPETL